MRKNWWAFLGVPRLSVGAVLPAIFVFASVSRAGLYGITFDDGNGNAGSGQIDVEGGYAVSGSFDVTSGAAIGVWTLTGGTPSSTTQSPGGYFTYDNMVNLGSDPYLTTAGGLLFTDNNSDQLNMWANANGGYDLWAESGGIYIVEAGSYPSYPDATSPGTGTINSVPEPITCALAGFGLIFVGGRVGRYYSCRRHSATAS